MTLQRQITMIEGLETELKVGMEIHVELATRTKMWTAMPNVAHADYFDAEPNSIIDPVVIGMPGTLPVMNRAALEMSIKVGLALGCEITRWSKWDRKSYYYPDLPKNYQISQYDLPICGPGALEVPINDQPDAPTARVGIIRAHLEEDAGKLLHEAPGGRPIDYSIVDLNRAGTPLLEIVTEPDITSADQAVMFGQALRNICRFLGVTEGVMQRGHMRFEPNINVIIHRDGRQYATPIVEIKNLNSFKAVHGAITHEHRRQVEQWLETGQVMGERAKTTRGWDDARGVTLLQRHKEDADEYRYFPDPDLVPVVVDDAWIQRLKKEIPELPLQRQQRYIAEYDLEGADARWLCDDKDRVDQFEQYVDEGVPAGIVVKRMRNDFAQYLNDHPEKAFADIRLPGGFFLQVHQLQEQRLISAKGTSQVLAHAFDDPAGAGPARTIAEQLNLLQVSDDSALDAWVAEAIEAEPKAADDVRSGNMKAIGRLVGAVMKLSKGQANPQRVQQKLRQALEH